MSRVRERTKQPPHPVVFMGVDIGQVNDYTAIVVLDEVPPRATSHRFHDPKISYACRYVERLQLGTPYQDQVRHVAQLARHLTKDPGASVYVAVDATGVGRPVVDLLRAEGIPLYEITITGGQTMHYEGGGWRVPKRDLISCTQLLLQQQRLKFAEQLPHLAVLTNELQNYRVKISAAGHDSYNAREGTHDDLVLALSVAAYTAETLTTYAPG